MNDEPSMRVRMPWTVLANWIVLRKCVIMINCLFSAQMLQQCLHGFVIGVIKGRLHFIQKKERALQLSEYRQLQSKACH